MVRIVHPVKPVVYSIILHSGIRTATVIKLTTLALCLSTWHVHYGRLFFKSIWLYPQSTQHYTTCNTLMFTVYPVVQRVWILYLQSFCLLLYFIQLYLYCVRLCLDCPVIPTLCPVIPTICLVIPTLCPVITTIFLVIPTLYPVYLRCVQSYLHSMWLYLHSISLQLHSTISYQQCIWLPLQSLPPFQCPAYLPKVKKSSSSTISTADGHQPPSVFQTILDYIKLTKTLEG